MICNWPLCLWGSKEQYTLNLPTIIPNKGDFKIEKQLPRRNMKYIKCLLYPLPLYATKIINPFPNSWISANPDKVERL